MPTMEKLYFICSSGSDNCYTIHALDLSEQQTLDPKAFYLPKPPDPILTLPILDDEDLYPMNMSFGMLGRSKLYMIGGYIKQKVHYVPCTTVYILDTSKLIPTNNNSLDHREFVKRANPLIAPKPDALVIPVDGRIYVFAKSLNPGAAQPLIEFLDHRNWSSVELPPNLADLVDHHSYDDPYEIRFHTTTPMSDILLMFSLPHRRRSSRLFILKTACNKWRRVDVLPYDNAIHRNPRLRGVKALFETSMAYATVQWLDLKSGLVHSFVIPVDFGFEHTLLTKMRHLDRHVALTWGNRYPISECEGIFKTVINVHLLQKVRASKASFTFEVLKSFVFGNIYVDVHFVFVM